MQMQARTWQGTAEGYRYSHNSHEKEDAIYKGAQSAEYWMYDSRIMRRWEMDPIIFAWQSPYAVFNNCPIKLGDLLGATSSTIGPRRSGDLNLPQAKRKEKTVINPPPDQLPSLPTPKLPTSTPEAELRTAPTMNGQSNIDPSSPGGYVGNIEIINAPNNLAELLSHHDFGHKASVNLFGLEYNFAENQISFEYRRKWLGKGFKSWDGGIAPSISLGTGGMSYGPGNFGPYGVSTNGSDVNFFEVWGSNTTIKQFAVINRGAQNVSFYTDFNHTMTLSVPTSTTIYTFLEKGQFSYMVINDLNLKVTSQTFFDLGGWGTATTQDQINADTNYKKGRVVAPLFNGKVTIKVE